MQYQREIEALKPVAHDFPVPGVTTPAAADLALQLVAAEERKRVREREEQAKERRRLERKRQRQARRRGR